MGSSLSERKQHLTGPVDGSLYATILKSPSNSNKKPPSVILSPPAEFRESSLSPYTKSRLSASTQSLQVYPSSNYTQERQYLSPTPSTTSTLRNNYRSGRDYSPSLASTVAESVTFQRAFSTPPQEQGRYQSQTINHRHNVEATINQQSHPQRSQFVREIRVVEEFQRPEQKVATGRGLEKSANAKLGGNARDSLTASSMDSGISSSGLQKQRQMQVHNSK